MCDYSLMAIPNRLAVSGEEFVVHRFGQGSVGLAVPCDLQKRQEYRKVRSHGFWPRLKEFLILPWLRRSPQCVFHRVPAC